jgi:hypothetical protein
MCCSCVCSSNFVTRFIWCWCSLQEFVEQASGALVGLYAELIGAVLPNISHPNPDIQQVGGRSSNPASHSLTLTLSLVSPCEEPTTCDSGIRKHHMPY